MEIRTRMAPSPTGKLHLGTAYATLWPYIFARGNKGVFILRFEDTDQERSTKEFEKNIEEGLKWLGYDWDEGPFHQMDRLEIYQQYSKRLLEEDHAYYCFCSKDELDEERRNQTEAKVPQIYSGKCRSLTMEQAKEKIAQGLPYVIRFKMPEDLEAITFSDLIHGEVSFDPKLIGDTVIMRQNGIALYNFAVVVDDIEMNITHVIRGDDHLSNTPKQVVLFKALGKSLPQFAHYPMILNQDRIGKLSKRTGSTSVEEYKLEGYLSEALINYLISLGWTHPKEQEIYSIAEVIEEFDFKSMGDTAAAWNEQKLDWINGEYIRAMSDEELTIRLQEFLVDHPAKEKITPVVPLIKERIKKLSDFIPLTYFFWEKPEYDREVFEKLDTKDFANILERIEERLFTLEKPWKADEFEQAFRDLAQEIKVSTKDTFQLIRIAVTGQLVSPPLFESIELLGEEETLSRVKKSKEFITNG